MPYFTFNYWSNHWKIRASECSEKQDMVERLSMGKKTETKKELEIEANSKADLRWKSRIWTKYHSITTGEQHYWAHRRKSSSKHVSDTQLKQAYVSFSLLWGCAQQISSSHEQDSNWKRSTWLSRSSSNQFAGTTLNKIDEFVVGFACRADKPHKAYTCGSNL